jgi:N-methylhydantoinase B
MFDLAEQEVLRHRLGQICLEGATALQRVSGSPLATEAFDMNTAILSVDGEVAFTGPYLLTGPVGQGLIVRQILSVDRPDPIEPGDVFLCNNPYAGAAHQNCVTLVAPVHMGERLIAWAGATLHVVDVGGPAVGQIGIGARSIHDEAPVFGPVKLVRAGRLDTEVEDAYLSGSRTPDLNALDLRAKLAAVHVIRSRLVEVAGSGGADAVSDAIRRTLDHSSERFRRRLRELPDGEASHESQLEHEVDGETVGFAVRGVLRKEGDHLTADFSDSSPQADAVINCTRSGLVSGVLIGALTTLAWDTPWCPGALEPSITIVSEPGTVVDAEWPAGCSMATMAAGFAATTVTAVALGKLLAASPAHRSRAMAAWAGAVGSIDMFGTDGAGRPFGTVLLDSMAAGAGATASHDGVDCGGFLRSIGCVVANVEQYEARYPLLYLWRRQEPDTGGPGTRRGGHGVGFAVTPHGTPRIETVSPHFSGTTTPESAGLDGGHPGATNRVTLVRRSGVPEAFTKGRIPVGLEELDGMSLVLPGVTRFSMEEGDTLVVATSGGGGFGDPYDREPELVAEDVRLRLMSAAAAAAHYGVVVGDDGTVNRSATVHQRAAMRGSSEGRGMKVALLLVDIQNEVFHPDGVLAGDFPSHAAPMLDAVRRLVGWAREHDHPVIWLRLAFRPGHFDAVRDSMSRARGTFVDGTWGAELLAGLGRLDADVVVTKKRPSGFFDTDLAIVLRGLGVGRLVVGGASTNWAVESTVRDGHSHDLEMVVVRDAVATPFTDLHEPSLQSMATVFAKVVTLEELLAGA